MKAFRGFVAFDDDEWDWTADPYQDEYEDGSADAPCIVFVGTQEELTKLLEQVQVTAVDGFPADDALEN